MNCRFPWPLLLLVLSAQQALAGPADRWVKVAQLPLRANPEPSAAVVGQIYQGSRVRLSSVVSGDGGWCMVETHLGLSFAACGDLSEQPVTLPHAGVDGVPADRRWVGGSNLLLRAEPRPDAPVLGRLALNTALRQTADDAGSGYCGVQRLSGAGGQAQSGFIACRFLQRTPVELDKLAQPQLDDGSDNPDFDPARAFWIAPDWELMARYARRVALQRDVQGASASKGPDEQLERMKARLSGQVVDSREPATVWLPWQDVLDDAAAPQQARSLATDLNLFGGEFDNGASGGSTNRIAAFVRALPALPQAAPSWWKADAELAAPGESLAALATRFGAQQQWLHESLQPGSPHRGAVEPGERIERLTQPQHRISLLADQRLRDERVAPETRRIDWDPTVDFSCAGWVGGFEHGDSDAATYRRNSIDRKPPTGALTLFRFWSARALPAGPARWTRQPFMLDRAATGFTSGEWRTVDLDGDGIADLAWLQATGRGPGHLGDPPRHDDAWFRLLLANVAGRWRLLAVDTFAYGCGC